MFSASTTWRFTYAVPEMSEMGSPARCAAATTATSAACPEELTFDHTAASDVTGPKLTFPLSIIQSLRQRAGAVSARLIDQIALAVFSLTTSPCFMSTWTDQFAHILYLENTIRRMPPLVYFHAFGSGPSDARNRLRHVVWRFQG